MKRGSVSARSRRTFRKVSVAAVALALVLSLGAGGVLAQTRVRISGWGGVDIAIVEELVDRFVRPAVSSQGIEVVYEPITDDFNAYLFNALSAGTAPDLFYVDIFWSEGLFRSGRVEPLDRYMQSNPKLSASDFVPELIDAFSVDSKVYGIPKDFNTLAVFYNKDLFDLAGVPYPDENDDWNTFTEKLRKVTNPQLGVYGIAVPPDYARFAAFAYAAGFEPFDATGQPTANISGPAFAEAFRWYTSLVKEGIGIPPADIGQGWGGGAFAAEKVAVAIEGAWMLGFLRDQAPNLRYGTTFIPKHPRTGKRGNLIFTVSWSLNAASKVKDAAIQVLQALTGPEAQQWVLERGLAIPSRAALTNNPYFSRPEPEAQANRVVFLGASDGNVHPFKFGRYGGDWMTPINEALTAVLSGELAVDQALEQAQTRLNQLMGR